MVTIKTIERLVAEGLSFLSEHIRLGHAGRHGIKRAFEDAPIAQLVLVNRPAVTASGFAGLVMGPSENDPHAKRADPACDQEARKEEAAVLTVAPLDLIGLGREKPEVALLVFPRIVDVSDVLCNEPPDDHGPPIEIAGVLGDGKSVVLPEVLQDVLHDDVVLEGYPLPDVCCDRSPLADHKPLPRDRGVLQNPIPFPIVAHRP